MPAEENLLIKKRADDQNMWFLQLKLTHNVNGKLYIQNGLEQYGGKKILRKEIEEDKYNNVHVKRKTYQVALTCHAEK